MIVTCPHCQKTLKAPDSAAGKRIRCPGCLEVIPAIAASNVSAGSGSAPRPANSGVSSKPGKPPAQKPQSPLPQTPSPSADSRPKSGGASSRTDGEKTKLHNSSTRRSTMASGNPTTRSSQPGKRPQRSKPEKNDNYDDDYDSGYESAANDPWNSVPSWEEANPYASPAYPSSSRGAASSSGGSLRVAGIGLLIQAWSSIGILVTLFSFVAIVFIVGASGAVNATPRDFGVMMGGLALIAMIPLGIGVFVGYVMCAFVPAKSQARVPIIVALSITVVSGILWLLQSVGTAMQSHGMVIGLGILRMLLYAGQMVSFSLFMKAAATFVRRDDLGKMAMVVMGGLLVTPLFGYLAIIAVPFFGSEVDPVVGMVALGIAGIFGLAFIVFWVMQLFLMFRLGSAMKNR